MNTRNGHSRNRPRRTGPSQAPGRVPILLGILSLGGLALGGCGDNTGTQILVCTGNTVSVSASVTVGDNVDFRWDPSCDIAALFVESSDSVMWAVGGDGELGDLSPADNVILPFVRYGSVPSGAREILAPRPLEEGEDYTLVLWRILPAASTIPCPDLRVGNACRVEVEEFVR